LTLLLIFKNTGISRNASPSKKM